MRLRCRLGWHNYIYRVVKCVNSVRITQDECECGAYRNIEWAIIR